MTPIEDMLTMIDKGHSIVIDDNIGLLGEGIETEELDAAELAYIRQGYDIDSRGKYWRIIDKDGCILIDKFVTMIGIVEEYGITVAYIFVLKDYRVKDEFNSFFESGATKEAVVIYSNGKLTTNCEELGLEINDSIDITEIVGHQYRLYINNDRYISYIINSDNNIYGFSKKEHYIRSMSDD
jgi:hypothetical protein